MIRPALLVVLGLLAGSGCSFFFEETAAKSDPGQGGDGGVDPSAIRLWSGPGSVHSCATRGSMIVCWGANNAGQLGVGNNVSIGDDERADRDRAMANLPAPIVQVTTGWDHTCALTEPGDMYCWGEWQLGALGFGNSPPSADAWMVVPTSVDDRVPVGSPVSAIGATEGVTCALIGDEPNRDVLCWGQGTSSVLCSYLGAKASELCNTVYGDGEKPIDNADLLQVPLAGPAKELAVGSWHACGVLENGDLQCWGANATRALGEPGSSDEKVGQALTPANPLRGLALGLGFGCGIDTDDNVLCWGNNDSGQNGQGNSQGLDDFGYGLSEAEAINFKEPVTKVVAGDEHACALFADHTMQCWGEGQYGALGRGDGLSFGDNELAQNEGPLALEGVTDITAGYDHTCAALQSGEIVCWGLQVYQRENFGPLGSGIGCEILVEHDDHCSYGDDGSESLAAATRLLFDWQ